MVGDERSTTVVVVAVGDVEVIVARVEAAGADLAVVDALARLQLAARRLGCSIKLHHPGEELGGLLDLVGLAATVGAGDLPLEAGREAEGGEELGVEEVVPPRDPPA